MKLMTHNLLMCNKKGCTTNNFPLFIKSTKTVVNSMDYDDTLVKRFLKKLDLPALTVACKNLDLYKFDFENLSSEELEQEEVLRYIHHIIFEVGIEEGALICNGCSKEYSINNGVPNLVLGDDEV